MTARDLRPPCTWDPQLFDRLHDDETHSQANERMEYAARLCRTVCPRLAACRAEKDVNPRLVQGVMAGQYRPFGSPRGRRKVDA